MHCRSKSPRAGGAAFSMKSSREIAPSPTPHIGISCLRTGSWAEPRSALPRLLVVRHGASSSPPTSLLRSLARVLLGSGWRVSLRGWWTRFFHVARISYSVGGRGEGRSGDIEKKSHQAFKVRFLPFFSSPILAFAGNMRPSRQTHRNITSNGMPARP